MGTNIHLGVCSTLSLNADLKAARMLVRHPLSGKVDEVVPIRIVWIATISGPLERFSMWIRRRLGRRHIEKVAIYVTIRIQYFWSQA